MLCYRGLIPLGTWNKNDIDQVLRDLDICRMSAFQALSRYQLLGYDTRQEEGSIEEWRIYGTLIDVIRSHVKFIKERGETDCDSPPISFVVVKDVVFLFVGFRNNKKELVSDIEEVHKKVVKFDSDFSWRLVDEKIAEME